MRVVLLLVFVLSHLMAFEQKTEISLSGIAYSNYNNEIVAEGNSEITLDNAYFQTDTNIEFLYSNEYKQRRYLLLNELYISKGFDAYSVSLGKKMNYWGELEGFNIADVYNQKNYLKNPFDKSAKHGAWGANITRYFEENSLEFGLKFYEEDIPLPTNHTPYASLSMNYDKELRLSNERYSPTPYLKLNFVSDEYLDTETSLILLHGYDNKRSFIPISATTLSQYAYRVNKALLLSHIIYTDTIFKTELAYTNVVDNAQMSDYTQISAGVEHSFYELIGSTDITLFSEYYRYIYSDTNKLKNVDISEIYDNDFFLALRMNFNDVKSSELKVGILQDIQKTEQVIKATLNTRVYDSFVIDGEYLQIRSSTKNTILSHFGNSSRFTLALHYTF